MPVTISYNQSNKSETVISDSALIHKAESNDSCIDIFTLHQIEAGSTLDITIPKSQAHDLDVIKFTALHDPYHRFATIDCTNADYGLHREIKIEDSVDLALLVVRKSTYNCYYTIELELTPKELPLKIEYHVDDQDPLKVHFDVSGGVQPWLVDFGDGTPAHEADAGGVAHTYAVGGTYSATVTDSNQNTAVTILSVTAPPAPPPPPEPEPELVLPLSLLSATVPNEPEKRVFKIEGGEGPYLFDAGDGNDPIELTEAGTQEWVYTASGSFTASVLDNTGSEATKKVIISLA